MVFSQNIPPRISRFRPPLCEAHPFMDCHPTHSVFLAQNEFSRKPKKVPKNGADRKHQHRYSNSHLLLMLLVLNRFHTYTRDTETLTVCVAFTCSIKIYYMLQL